MLGNVVYGSEDCQGGGCRIKIRIFHNSWYKMDGPPTVRFGPVEKMNEWMRMFGVTYTNKQVHKYITDMGTNTAMR